MYCDRDLTPPSIQRSRQVSAIASPSAAATATVHSVGGSIFDTLATSAADLVQSGGEWEDTLSKTIKGVWYPESPEEAGQHRYGDKAFAPFGCAVEMEPAKNPHQCRRRRKSGSLYCESHARAYHSSVKPPREAGLSAPAAVHIRPPYSLKDDLLRHWQTANEHALSPVVYNVAIALQRESFGDNVTGIRTDEPMPVGSATVWDFWPWEYHEEYLSAVRRGVLHPVPSEIVGPPSAARLIGRYFTEPEAYRRYLLYLGIQHMMAVGIDLPHDVMQRLRGAAQEAVREVMPEGEPDYAWIPEGKGKCLPEYFDPYWFPFEGTKTLGRAGVDLVRFRDILKCVLVTAFSRAPLVCVVVEGLVTWS